ncbi:MAG: NAD(P)H-dependent oxidoreductase [Planctomycetes bacterium]|nr:NAD(P)H-dependent oxidoreductase [Planctomycetota bacterium]
MRQLIISCSLSPTSHSAILAQRLSDEIAGLGDEVRLIDLRKLELPFCDGDACYAHPNAQMLKAAIKEAPAITIATPIYNFETGGGTRNVVALGGDAFTDKVIGFLCSAGGENSYMAVMSLANSLMLDFRCIVVPRFVYASDAAFTDGRLSEPKIEGRVTELARELHRVASALS